MSTGNGAFVVHKQLETCIDEYSLHPYHPSFSLFPPLLPLFGCKRADIIHTTPDYGIFYKKRNSRLVLTFHNYVLDQFMHSYSSFLQNLHYKTDLKLFTRLSLQRADVLTSVSKFTANLVKQDMGLDQEIRVIYNGVDESKFVPAGSTNKGPEIKVLFSGNTSRRKGFNFLPELLPYLNKNIRIIYATGLRKNNPKFVSSRMVNLGSIPHEKMPSVYQKADILIFPSIREGFGLSVAEAMSCGLPVVAFNDSSLPELIDHGVGGYLADMNDAEKFSDYINTLAESPGLRAQMGEYNRNKVEEKFTHEQNGRGLPFLFEEVSDF